VILVINSTSRLTILRGLWITTLYFHQRTYRTLLCVCTEEKILYLSRDQEKDQEQFKETEIVSKEPLVDWLADNYKKYGANLQFVTNKSQQGFLFVLLFHFVFLDNFFCVLSWIPQRFDLNFFVSFQERNLWRDLVESELCFVGKWTSQS
jgi:hypothetical protein